MGGVVTEGTTTRLWRWGAWASGVVAYALVLGQPVVLLWESLTYLRGVPWVRLLTDDGWTPLFHEPQLGVFPLLFSTSLVVGVALAVGGGGALLVAWSDALPRGGAPGRMRRWIRSYEWLPPLLWVWFFLVWGVPVLQRTLGWWGIELARYSGLAAGLALAPVVFASVYGRATVAFEEARRILPAAHSLGIHGKMLYLRLWPRAALPGLVAALLAGAAVGFGESVVVTLLGGQAVRDSWSLLDPIQTVGAFLIQTALGDVSPSSPGRGPLALAAFLLWLVAGGFSSFAEAVGGRVGGGERRKEKAAGRPLVREDGTVRRERRAGKFLELLAVVSLILVGGLLLWEGGGFLLATSSAAAVEDLLASQGWPTVAGTLWMVGVALVGAGILSGGAAFLMEATGKRPWRKMLRLLLGIGVGTPPVVSGIAVLLGLDRMGLPGGTLLGGSIALMLVLLPGTIRAFQVAAAEVLSPEGRTAAVALGLDRTGTWRTLIVSAAWKKFIGELLRAVARVLGDPAPLLVLGAAVMTTFAPVAPLDPLVALPTHVFFWLTRSEPGFQGAVALMLLLLVMVAAGLRWMGTRCRRNA